MLDTVKSLSSKSLVVLFISTLLGLTGAALVSNLVMPQTVNVINPDVIVLLDDVLWNNNTLVDWGNVTVGELVSKNMTIINNSPLNLTITYYTEPLNVSIIHTWPLNNTYWDAGTNQTGVLSLYVNTTVPAGSYNFTAWIESYVT